MGIACPSGSVSTSAIPELAGAEARVLVKGEEEELKGRRE
jgi:hypothetical protein